MPLATDSRIDERRLSILQVIQRNTKDLILTILKLFIHCLSFNMNIRVFHKQLFLVVYGNESDR